jgi:hypothetical protein
MGDKSPIQNFLENHKSGGIHHICIEVFISLFHSIFKGFLIYFICVIDLDIDFHSVVK